MESSSHSTSGGRAKRLIGALLVVMALIPFVRTFGFGYVLDEVTAIRSNPDLHGWSALARLWSAGYGSPDAPFEGLYRPLTMVLFAVVWNLGGGWPIWFHLLAVALHAGATLLVWRVLSRGVGGVAATIGALWFAVHPVHVEAVANVANASEALVAIWTSLLVLHVYRSRRRDAVLRDAVVAGVLFLCALLSKESGAMAPFLAGLCAWGWRDRATPDAASAAASRRLVPMAIAFAAALVIVVALRSLVLGGPVTGRDIGAPGLDTLSFVERLRAMLSLGPTFARLLVWPAELNPSYGPSAFDGAASARTAATVVVLALLAAAGIRLARRGDRRLLAALAWIVVAFLPASNLLVATGQILAERTLYVPSIGVAMLVAFGVDAVLQRRPALRSVRSMRWGAAALAATALALGALALTTRRWTETWRSHESVYRQMIAADTANYRGYWSLAIYVGNNGNMDSALVLLDRAHGLFPRDPGLTFDYADALLRLGQAHKAAAMASQYMERDEYRTRPRAIGVYLEALGRAYGADSVAAAAERLMTSAPTATTALHLGLAHERRGAPDKAAQAYRQGLALSPGDRALQSKLDALASR